MATFDPYWAWFNIPANEQPPHHYRLLGLSPFESNRRRIETAVRERAALVRQRADGSTREAAREVLRQIQNAAACLRNPGAKSAYDSRLRAEMTTAALDGGKTASFPQNESAASTRPSEAAAGGDKRPRVRAVPAAGADVKPVSGAGSTESPAKRSPVRMAIYAGAAAAAVALLVGLTAVWHRFAGDDAETEAASGRQPSLAQAERNANKRNAAESPGRNDDRAAPDSAETTGFAGESVPPDGEPIPAEPQPINVVDAGDQPFPPDPGSQTPARADSGTTPTKPPESPAGPLAVEAPVPEVVTDVMPAEPAPRPLPEFASDRARRQYLQSVAAMLDAGLARRGADLEEASRHFHTARELTRDDPRLFYAYGLILLRHLRYDEAVEQFEAAGRAADDVYLPARQARIWLAVVRDDRGAALEQIVRLAEELQQSEAPLPDAARQRRWAEWTGRVMAYLTELADLDDQLSAEAADCDAYLREQLVGENLAAYKAGKSAVGRQHRQLVELIDLREAESAQQAEEERQEQKETIAAEKDATEEAKGELKMSAEKWKSWLDGETARLDAELELLGNQFQRLAARGRALNNSISQMQSQIASIELAGGRRGLTPLQQQKIRELQASVARLQGQYNLVDSQAALVRQKAKKLLGERRAAVIRYQRATGKIVKERKEISRLERTLERKSESIDERRGGSSARVASLKRRAKAFKTYVDLDFEEQKRRILASYPAARQ